MKQTTEELSVARHTAEWVSEQGEDPDFVAKTLLCLQRWDETLEKVLEHLELFLRFGLPVEEHMKLVRLIEEAKAQQRMERGEDADKLGL